MILFNPASGADRQERKGGPKKKSGKEITLLGHGMWTTPLKEEVRESKKISGEPGPKSKAAKTTCSASQAPGGEATGKTFLTGESFPGKKGRGNSIQQVIPLVVGIAPKRGRSFPFEKNFPN